MRARRGFTLIEVTLAIVVTAVVALLAYGAVSAAADTLDRVEGERAARLEGIAWRELIAGAVRAARSPREYEAATLIVQDGVDARGRPSDRLGLVTSASAPPLSPGADWRVVLGAGEAEGMVLRASALGSWQESRVVPGPEGLTGMNIEALGPTGWVSSWTVPAQLPRALRITFWAGDASAGPPLVLTLPMATVP